MEEALGVPEFEAVLVRRFPRDDDVRRKQFEFEDIFAQYINAKTVAAAAPPFQSADRPLFTMGDGKRLLLATEQSIQLTLNFGTAPKGGIRPAIARAEELMTRVQQSLAHQSRYYEGLIVSATFVPLSPEKARNLVYQEVFGRDPHPELDTFSASRGSVGARFNNQIDLQFVRQVEFSASVSPASPLVQFDVDFGPGDFKPAALLKFDVNSKPLKDEPEGSVFAEMVSALADLVRSDAQQVVGRSLGIGVAERLLL